MKDGKSILFACAVPAALVLGMYCTNIWIKARACEDKEHHDKCVAARVLFFEECFKVIPTRPECEALWSQKRGVVFDSPPDKPWADEVDCSKEIK